MSALEQVAAPKENPVRKILRRLWLVALVALCMTGAATSAHAVENTYYYPNYDASANGCVDLMSYVRRITVTVNGTDYTLDQLHQMKQNGQPLTLQVGDSASFNFLFGLQGRAYDANDQTLLDQSGSTYVTYTHNTTMLDGTAVAAGTQGILDDSSLMKENTARGGSYLRMDISWLLNNCPGDYNIEYTDGKISFYQGGENNKYLYVYFPGGIGSDVYAASGYFTLTATLSRTLNGITIPVTKNFYGQQTDWLIDLVVTDAVEKAYDGNISSYGRIAVKKNWVTNEDHGPATIVLSYTQNGERKTANRTLNGEGDTAYFDIRQGMTDCVISEDMTGQTDYLSTMTTSPDGKTYTFTNTKVTPIVISKKALGGSDELPGAKLTLYCVSSDGSMSQVDEWVSTTEPHEVKLAPGNFLLREVTAPAGYAMSTDISFTLNEKYEIKVTSQVGKVEDNVVTVIDSPLEVKLAKVDAGGNSLPGAAMTLTDKTTGKLVHSWTSGTEPEKITFAGNTGEVLVAGHTYILHEETAPAGYLKAEDLEFIFNGDGTIPGCGYHLVTMTDQPVGTPTPSPGQTPTPTPGGPTPTPGGPTATPGTPTPPPGVPTPPPDRPDLATGDSPLMWVFLALAFVCLGAGVVVLFLRRRRQGRDPSQGRDE